MIKLTHLDGNEFLLNEFYIETIECSPDTIIAMQNGQRIIVKEDLEEIMAKIRAYQKSFKSAK